jgi:hypothetical protein
MYSFDSVIFVVFIKTANTFQQAVYERVPFLNSYDQVRGLASQMVHKGVNGSLASILSSSEQDFVLGNRVFLSFYFDRSYSVPAWYLLVHVECN